MKIIYCINSIRGLGGIQRVTLVKANALAEVVGNQVYLIVTDNWPYHKLIHEISDKITLIHLPINYYADDYKSKFQSLISNIKIFKHWRLLQKAINQIKPDVIVSVGQSEKYILPFLRTKAIKIREIHFNSNYREFTYQTQWIGKLIQFLDLKINTRGYDKVILLTEEDKKDNFANNNKFTAIHNPLTTRKLEYYKRREKKNVIAVGRLVLQKNFISLIRAWALIATQIPDWHLNIIGEGPERERLQNEINQLHLEKFITLKGFSNEVDKELEQSSISVITSVYEGFGLVILEAMAMGLPVISYTFPYGPRDIIENGTNGFLVPNQDEQALSARILDLVQNEELRNRMGQAALKRTYDFDISLIVQKWMTLFYNETQQKRRK